MRTAGPASAGAGAGSVIPQRRCVGCGSVAPKSELVRLALVREGDCGRPHAVLDRSGKLPGRGAYVCLRRAPAEPAPRCLQRAWRGGRLARALRLPESARDGRPWIDHELSELIESVGR